MTKYFILNVVLTFAIAFIVYSSIMSFQAGNQTFLFISIALLVVLVYFKVVLLKVVKRNAAETKTQKTNKKGAK